MTPVNNQEICFWSDQVSVKNGYICWEIVPQLSAELYWGLSGRCHIPDRLFAPYSNTWNKLEPCLWTSLLHLWSCHSHEGSVGKNFLTTLCPSVSSHESNPRLPSLNPFHDNLFPQLSEKIKKGPNLTLFLVGNSSLNYNKNFEPWVKDKREKSQMKGKGKKLSHNKMNRVEISLRVSGWSSQCSIHVGNCWRLFFINESYTNK